MSCFLLCLAKSLHRRICDRGSDTLSTFAENRIQEALLWLETDTKNTDLLRALYWDKEDPISWVAANRAVSRLRLDGWCK